ncbi:hypothetical protein [Flavobacterium sp.]|uniref:hypothetical protein n=2 Tax=Flavobacterium sp. TaxID=239 RepID=UPI004048DBB9
MKKLFILFISLNLTSCFTEPKKESTKNSVKIETENSYKNEAANVEIKEEEKTIKTEENVEKNALDFNNWYSTDDKINLKSFLKYITKSSDEFENFILFNDYRFDYIKEYDNFKIIYYKKDESFLSFAIDKFNNTQKGMIYFETNSKNMYLSLKDEATKLGFKYVSTETFNKEVSEQERLYNKYSNGVYELNFIINNEPNKLGYSVGLNKIRQ